jgi:hypothetical protein
LEFLENKSEPASVPTGYLCSDPKIIINKLEKKKILEQLKALGITQSTIYPEIDKVAEHLKEIYGG